MEESRERRKTIAQTYTERPIEGVAGGDVGQREDLLQLGATDSSGQLPHIHILELAVVSGGVFNVILKREPRKQSGAPGSLDLVGPRTKHRYIEQSDAPCLGIVDLCVSPQISPNVSPSQRTGVGPTPTWKHPRLAQGEL